MSTPTKDKTPEESDGLNENTAVNLDGNVAVPTIPTEGDQSPKGGVEAGTESWTPKKSLENASVQASLQNDCRGSCQGSNERKPALSRVIDKKGNARITIFLGRNERVNHLAMILGLIDSASENDVVDLTIISDIGSEDGTIEQRSILSALDRCRATVITRAGVLSSVGDVAIWLSGDQLKMPRIGSIFMRQPVCGFFGDTADYESRLADHLASMREFSEFIVARGLFTQEELDAMYTNRSMCALFGAALHDRISKLQPV